MTDAARPSVPDRRRWDRRLLILPGLAVLAGAFLWMRNGHPRAPDLAPLASAPPVIQLHVAGALTALAVGTVLLLGVKGTQRHRGLGWAWVVAMATTAISSLFIHTINPGGFSLIHLISGWTIVALPMAVYAARRHRVAVHRRSMTAMFVGGLLIAGAFAFLPGRLMWAVFFG